MAHIPNALQDTLAEKWNESVHEKSHACSTTLHGSMECFLMPGLQRVSGPDPAYVQGPTSTS